VAEQFFCIYFTVEWIVRFMAFRRKRDCLRDGWMIFDTGMVTIMVVETWIMALVLLLASNGNPDSGMGDASLVRLLRLLRLSRMARMARLLQSIPELLILIKGMVAAIRSVLFTLLLLMIVLYVFGIAFVSMLADAPSRDIGFHTVPEAMHTLLLRGTLMDGIGEVVYELGADSIAYVVVFYIFVLVSALTVMNMLIGVLCEVISAVAVAEREEITVAHVCRKLRETLDGTGLDVNGDGLISRAEFSKILENGAAARTLKEVGIDVLNLVDLQAFIFEGEDEDGIVCEKQLTFPDFLELVLQLRGSNMASVKDIVDLRKFVGIRCKEVETRIEKMVKKSFKTSEDSRATYMSSVTCAQGEPPCFVDYSTLEKTLESYIIGDDAGFIGKEESEKLLENEAARHALEGMGIDLLELGSLQDSMFHFSDPDGFMCEQKLRVSEFLDQLLPLCNPKGLVANDSNNNSDSLDLDKILDSKFQDLEVRITQIVQQAWANNNNKNWANVMTKDSAAVPLTIETSSVADLEAQFGQRLRRITSESLLQWVFFGIFIYLYIYIYICLLLVLWVFVIVLFFLILF
ncbi:unnamed protein product, partial [Polarella glacialis]